MKYKEKVARCIRLMIIRMQYQNGSMTQDQAIEILKGRLDPNKEESQRDDSRFLEKSPEKILKFFDLLSPKETYVSNLEKHHTNDVISKMLFGDKK